MFYCPRCLTFNEKSLLNISLITTQKVTQTSFEDLEDSNILGWKHSLTNNKGVKVNVALNKDAPMNFSLMISCPKGCVNSLFALKNNAIITKTSKDKFTIIFPNYNEIVIQETQYSRFEGRGGYNKYLTNPIGFNTSPYTKTHTDLDLQLIRYTKADTENKETDDPIYEFIL